MDIKKLSITELKALYYDRREIYERESQNLNLIVTRIKELETIPEAAPDNQE